MANILVLSFQIKTDFEGTSRPSTLNVGWYYPKINSRGGEILDNIIMCDSPKISHI
jgi:hypothetical protein